MLILRVTSLGQRNRKSESPTGIEPMTFRKPIGYCITTEIQKTRDERGGWEGGGE